MDRSSNNWKQKAKKLKSELYTLYLASKHYKTPWYCKALALLIIAYALSPIDLIPDFIPVLGYLDDVILLPLGIYFTFKWIPQEVIAECREQAKQKIPINTVTKWFIGTLIIIIWLAILVGIVYWLMN
ncbi:uncharacterized protein DUF1232 [Scopulibacillus darangshiensis]|uniref:Uncharacterized protein DUF1232 n=1 Tax=Scopulibacillus darangshiensis TaxID=442528 RepID=A0A4R2NSH9_9BACL|nr:YkvA family protein [Scopulibacillus darangshiensis]TCP24840.1 uncharacterized protein DUF1232 [Scopulibacillus darangshiensis]